MSKGLEINEMGDFSSPLAIKIGFKKLFDSYRSQLASENAYLRDRAEAVLAIEAQYPILSEGVMDKAKLVELKEPIDFILADLFPAQLTQNEIKIATAPFQENILKATKRYQDIREIAGQDFKMELSNFSPKEHYIMACSIVLSVHYGINVDFKRPFHYKIPDANGILHSYRVLYNGDFVNIERGPNAKDITKEDVAMLLDNFENLEMWKDFFPPHSWYFNGFVIANMYDATIDVSISNFKEDLLELDAGDDRFVKSFRNIIRSIFNYPEIEVGFAQFNKEDQTFNKIPNAFGISSFLLDSDRAKDCHQSLCDHSYEVICLHKKSFTISNIPGNIEKYPENPLFKAYHEQGIASAIITPLVAHNELLGVMEIVSKKPGELNSINANKLQDILPFLVDSLRRSKEEKENLLELLIQSECTSIHPSVHWRFRKEAERVLKLQQNGQMANFREVVFKEVYPLFGQMDIKGSSESRNEATKKDLVLQLKLVHKIIEKIHAIEPLPIYEQLSFSIKEYRQEIREILEVDTEQKVLSFLQEEIIPLYRHLENKSDQLKKLIQGYYDEIDPQRGFVYQHRKDYDDSVALVNRTLASILDRKQNEAQGMYSHYYERFKTDGVEHNMYIGESITKEMSFNKIYLYNLRLWQLQVMCEMENSFYQLKHDLPVPMEVASMILVFSNSLSLRFRMDEKRFDVDGTYNARYEVVKKRVDKAFIKNTEERITQPGKITIVYSQTEDEKEYFGYIKFLQSKKYLGNDVEVLELEDLQGVTGLKALRVNVLYKNSTEDKEYYTYEDLMETLR